MIKNRYVGCMILSKDRKILLQQRGNNWQKHPGYLSEFGGRIEENETPMEALVRELQEELGAKVNPDEVVSLGEITEAIANHAELIYVYFWHDKHGSIIGCYEGEAKYFDNVKSVLEHPRIMDSVRWLLEECEKRGFF
jgi:8-oxo-dGTP diphosphatase